MLTNDIYEDRLKVAKYVLPKDLVKFFDNIFSQQSPSRISKEGSSRIYMNRLYERAKFENSKFGETAKGVIRIFR